MDDVYAPALAEGWSRLNIAGLLPLPLGAIVATCGLVDVVPILAPGEDASPGVDRYVPHVAENHRGALWYWKGENCYAARPSWDIADVSDQRPYGDFTPGRWAWILDDVKSTTERCPLCWGSGSWPYPLRQCCPACRGTLACGPVPAKGQRGLWNWQYMPEESCPAETVTEMDDGPTPQRCTLALSHKADHHWQAMYLNAAQGPFRAKSVEALR